MVGLMGVGAVIKKRGGYTNTKVYFPLRCELLVFFSAVAYLFGRNISFFGPSYDGFKVTRNDRLGIDFFINRWLVCYL